MSDVSPAPVIHVENLSLSLNGGEPVVEDVSFDVGPGQILGLVGESGSGKTTTALSLLGYTKPGVYIRGGTIEVAGQSIVGRDAKSMRSMRGKVVSYVPQDPGGGSTPRCGSVMRSWMCCVPIALSRPRRSPCGPP